MQVCVRPGTPFRKGAAYASLSVLTFAQTDAVRVWGVVRERTWDDFTEGEHARCQRQYQAALDTSLHHADETVADLEAALQVLHVRALGQSYASAVAVRIDEGRLRAAGSGRMGVWTLTAGKWTVALAPMTFRVTNSEPGSSGTFIDGCLGHADDEHARIATCDRDVGPGTIVLVGLDANIEFECLPEISSSHVAFTEVVADVLAAVAEPAALSSGAWVALRI